MKNFKFLIGTVILLVIINCVLLGSLWFTKYHISPPPPPPHLSGPPQRANEYLIKELKLTPAQIKQYDTLRNDHFEKTRALNDQNRQLRDAYFENIKTPVLNTKLVDSLQNKIAANTITLDNITLVHFRKLRSILDKNQQTKFDKIIANAMHMMGGPQNGPQGRPPHQDMRGPGGPEREGMPPHRGMGKGRHRGGPQGPGMYGPPDGMGGPDGRRGPPPDGMGRPGGPPPDGMGRPPQGRPDRDMMPPPDGPGKGRRPGDGPPPGGGPPPGY